MVLRKTTSRLIPGLRIALAILPTNDEAVSPCATDLFVPGLPSRTTSKSERGVVMRCSCKASALISDPFFRGNLAVRLISKVCLKYERLAQSKMTCSAKEEFEFLFFVGLPQMLPRFHHQRITRISRLPHLQKCAVRRCTIALVSACGIRARQAKLRHRNHRRYRQRRRSAMQ